MTRCQGHMICAPQISAGSQLVLFYYVWVLGKGGIGKIDNYLPTNYISSFLFPILTKQRRVISISPVYEYRFITFVCLNMLYPINRTFLTAVNSLETRIRRTWVVWMLHNLKCQQFERTCQYIAIELSTKAHCKTCTCEESCRLWS